MLKIFLDYQGTLVEQYPYMKRCNFGCIEVIKKLQDAGHELIINTDYKEEAKKMLNEQYWMFLRDGRQRDNFELKPITKALKDKSRPDRWDWETMKETGEMYIDDLATDIPLKNCCMTQGQMVDWDILDKQFTEQGIYDNQDRVCVKCIWYSSAKNCEWCDETLNKFEATS